MTRAGFLEKVTTERLKLILKVIQEGLALYANPEHYSAAAKRDHTPSVRAAIRNAHIIGCANRLIEEHPELGIRFVKKGNRPLFYIDDHSRVSFKKLNKNLQASNYPTRQAEGYKTQQWPVEEIETGNLVARKLLWPQDMLPPEKAEIDNTGALSSLWPQGMLPPLATNLFAGYVANKTETDFTYWIVCPDGENSHWVWPLTPDETVELIQAPVPAETPAAQKIRHRVRPRPEILRKQANDDSEK